MDPVVSTSRLKLSLITKAERGSQEIEWLHEIFSDEKATWWSIRGRSKSLDDTEQTMSGILPTGKEGSYRVVYAVHQILEPSANTTETSTKSHKQNETPTKFIGLVKLKSSDDGTLPLPEHLTLPASAAPTTLTTEISYMFLPAGWGKGYATESINALLEVCRKNKSFWSPYSRVYIRTIVNDENAASRRVLEKVGMVKRGVYEWSGEAVFLGGVWRERERLHVYGGYLLK